MQVRFADNNETVTVSNYTELVTWMREHAPHSQAADNRAYMLGYARRAVQLNDQDIEATSEDAFVRDLIANRHISVTA